MARAPAGRQLEDRNMFSVKTLRRMSVCTLVLTAALAGAAQAASAAPAPSVKVSYRDLNVRTEAGAALLYQRIRGAARFVCGTPGRRFEERAQWHSCVRDAISGAVTTVHSPLLSALDAGAAAPQAKTTQRR
jgi:UrcA family protein